MRLPEFNPSVRVSAVDAKTDRILVTIGDWHIIGVPYRIADFFKFLGPYPASPAAMSRFSRFAGEITEDRFGWMFNRHSGEGERIPKLKLRGPGRGSGATHGGPLVSGYLNISKGVPVPRSGYLVSHRLRFDLKMNPTRFLRHQRWPENFDDDVTNWVWPETVMRSWDTRMPFNPNDRERETVLDGSNNLLQGPRALSMGRSEAWPYYLRRYFEGFERAVNAEFRRAIREADLQGENPTGARRLSADTHYNLDLVETYWEFKCEKAMRTVRSLESTLFALGSSATSRAYPQGRAERGLLENSPSILIALRGGRELRVYAKTDRRIRFEIIHNFKKSSACTDILNPHECRKTTQILNELLGWFPRIAEDAANQLNYVLRFIEMEMQTVEPSATTSDLIWQIFCATGDKARGETLLDSLVEHGRIKIERSNSPFLEDVKKLRRKGVLMKRLGSDVPTPYYRQALAILRQQTGVLSSENEAD